MDDQSLHLGTKLEAEAERLGMKKKQLAEYFGIKEPSIHDTIKHGRLAKKHYQALVNLNGKPLEWWFDVVPPSTAGEPEPRYASRPAQQEKSEVEVLFERLPPSEQTKLIEALRAKVAYFDQLFEELKISR